MTAQGISDFRIGIDRVERREGQTFVVDGEGCYAPLEVVGDEMPPDFIENLTRLSDAQAATMFEAIRLSPFLSPEGKTERMTAMLQSGRVKLRFEIVGEKHRTRPRRAAREPLVPEPVLLTEGQIFDLAMTLGERGHEKG